MGTPFAVSHRAWLEAQSGCFHLHWAATAEALMTPRSAMCILGGSAGVAEHTGEGLRWEKSQFNSVSAVGHHGKSVRCWTAVPTTSHAPGGVSMWVGTGENRSLSESTPGLQIKTFFSLGGDSSSKLRCKPESHCYSSQHTELNQIPMCETETQIPMAELGPISNCSIISNKLSKGKWGGITHLTPCT